MTVAASYKTTAHVAEGHRACGAARELIGIGCSNDVEVALEVDSDSSRSGREGRRILCGVTTQKIEPDPSI